MTLTDPSNANVGAVARFEQPADRLSLPDRLGRSMVASAAESPLKIGFYTPNYPGISGEGGIGTYTRQMANALADAGHEIHVLTRGERHLVMDGKVYVHSSSTRHIPLLDRLWPGAGACWRVGRTMKHLVREYQLDLVEFAAWEGLALYFAVFRKVPMVVRLSTSSLETVEIDQLPMTRRLRADVRRERLTAGMADAIVTHSTAHRQTMAAELGMDPQRIRVARLGIPLASKMDCIEREPKTIVFLGRLERRKGTVDLLKAAEKVLLEHPDARFILIGADRPHCSGGRTHAQYVAEAFSPQVRSRISFAGRLPDEEVQSWLRRATLFVAPSLYESFGLVFLEAMQWGTPVIGTTAGGIPEVVENGKNGILVPPGDPTTLANVICELLNDPLRRQMFGEAGRARCEAEFSVDNMADRAISLYREVLVNWHARR